MFSVLFSFECYSSRSIKTKSLQTEKLFSLGPTKITVKRTNRSKPIKIDSSDRVSSSPNARLIFIYSLFRVNHENKFFDEWQTLESTNAIRFLQTNDLILREAQSFHRSTFHEINRSPSRSRRVRQQIPGGSARSRNFDQNRSTFEH